MVVESEVLKAQNCALSKFSLPMHSNEKIGCIVVMLTVDFINSHLLCKEPPFPNHGSWHSES